MSQLTRITFVPRHIAKTLDANHRALVSIHEPEDAPLETSHPWQHRLTVEFHDADCAEGGLKLFSREQAQEILSFADAVAPLVDEIVVHCLLGLSRSGAIAVFLSEKYGVPVFKQDLPLLQGYSLYNRHVYRMLHEAEYGAIGSAFGALDDSAEFKA